MSRSALLADDIFDADSVEWETVSLEELVLEFDPVKTQSVKEALEQIHQHEHEEGCSHEGEESEKEPNSIVCLEERNQ